MKTAKALLVLAAVAALAVVGTMVAGHVRQSQVDVYFDNGLGDDVTVSIDGETFELASGPPLRRKLEPGPHQIVVSGAEGEVERARVEVEELSLLTALLHQRFYVYNVAGAHIYRRAEHVYAADPNLRDYREELIAFERFFSQPHADFVFESAPDTITTKSSTTRREEFVVAHNVDYNTLANMRYAEGDPEGAKKALGKALELEPCHPQAYRNEMTLLGFEEKTEGAVSKAAAWIESCDGAGIDVHRAYQDTMVELGFEDEMLNRYRDRRRESPAAENDYLYARLVPDPEQALSVYRRALDKSPGLTRARLALSYELLGLERYQESLAELSIALDDPEHIQETVYLYALAAVGADKSAEAGGTLSELAGRFPDDMTLWEARWTTALAREDWDEAERLLTEYQVKMRDDGWSYRAQLLRLAGESDQAKRLLALAAEREDRALEAVVYGFENLFEQGRYHEALGYLEALPPASFALYRLYGACGLLLSGNRDEALSMLEALETELGRGKQADFYRVSIGALTGEASEGAVLTKARRVNFLMLPHAYFMLAVHHQARGQTQQARRYLQKSRRSALDRAFPYVAARRLESSL